MVSTVCAFSRPSRLVRVSVGVFVLHDYVEPRPGARKLCWDVTVEIEGQEKPALVAKWHSLRVERKS